MKYNLHVNQAKAIELGITNINQAHIFDLLSICSVWAEPIIIDKVVYYWVARQAISDELKILNLKNDTVYRHLKFLDKLGLIEYKKSGKKDCIKITKKGKDYHSDTMSEMNPSYYVGNKSENNSDLNPTYPTTNINPNIKKNKQKKNSENLILEVEETEQINHSEKLILIGFLEYRKTINKIIKTVGPVKAFLRELRNIHNAGFDIKAAIELMREKEWQTLKLEYIQNCMKSNCQLPQKENQSKTFYETTKEQKAIDQKNTMLNIANARILEEGGEI